MEGCYYCGSTVRPCECDLWFEAEAAKPIPNPNPHYSIRERIGWQIYLLQISIEFWKPVVQLRYQIALLGAYMRFLMRNR